MKDFFDLIGLRVLQTVAKILQVPIERKNRYQLKNQIRQKFSVFPEGGIEMSKKQIGFGCAFLVMIFVLVAFGTVYLLRALDISITPRNASESANQQIAQEPAPEELQGPEEQDSQSEPIVAPALVSPVLHHADSHAPEEGYGSFDIGVNENQIGLVFGVHILWPQGGLDAGGGGCNLVVLQPGWYENLQILDGRYEVYDVPSSDYWGWVQVLGQQRADEQAANYGCPVKDYGDLPQWQSPHPSPPQ